MGLCTLRSAACKCRLARRELCKSGPSTFEKDDPYRDSKAVERIMCGVVSGSEEMKVTAVVTMTVTVSPWTADVHELSI